MFLEAYLNRRYLRIFFCNLDLKKRIDDLYVEKFESLEKDCEKIYTEDSLLGDRRNMAYKGCEVNYGRGVGIVVA